MKKRKPRGEQKTTREPGWPPDEFGLMAELVLHDHVDADDLAASTAAHPEALAYRLRPLLDKGFVDTGVERVGTRERVFYFATPQGREAFFEQVKLLGDAITDVE